MTDWNEIFCERCGSEEFAHVSRSDGNIERWLNKCRTCGHEGEYLPTPEEIRQECLRIRRELGLPEEVEPSRAA